MASIESHYGSWRVVWREAGKKGTRSFATERAAKQFKIQVERQLHRTSIVNQIGGSDEKLREVATRYIASLTICELTRKSYQESIFAPFLAVFGSRTIASLRPVDLEEYFGQRRDKLRTTTLYKDCSVIRSFSAYITRHYLLPYDLMAKVKVRRVIKSTGLALSYAQEKALLDIANPYQTAKILLARDCGLRASNLAILTRKDVDFESQTLTFNVLKKGEQDVRDAESRTLPLTRRLQTCLMQFHGSDPQASLLDVRDKSICEPKRFIRYMWPKTGFRFRWHDLRHTFYTRLLEATDNYALAEWSMGHVITYWHPTPEKLRKAFDAMEVQQEAGFAAINREKFAVVGGSER